jgi:ketosteroid isomerase-like protein
MKRHLILMIAISGLLLGAACTSRGEPAAPISMSQTSNEQAMSEIKAVMANQSTAWNAGDIDGFMEGYWRSADLRFASGGTVTRGWQQTNDRYHARYDSADAMGKLSFTQLEVGLLSGDAAIVHGRWLLTRKADAPSGLFTLVFRRINGAWVIVSDTTTSAD